MVLESRETLKIKSISQAEYTVYKKIVIHDEKGKGLASVSIGSSDYVELKAVKATVFNEKGKRQGRYKKKHFTKHKSSIYGIIGNDDVTYEINLAAVTTLPFTVELEYTQIIKSLFFWPTWSPQDIIPVLSASYTLEVPPGYEFNSFSPSELSSTNPAKNTYVWSQVAIPAWPDEIAVPPEVYDRHRVFFAPDTFKLDQYSGSMSTWQGVADFYESLAQTQYELDPELVSDLDLKTATSLQDSISQIYDYVQNTTRYVGMELGIHGWKPHSSQWVCENKYGDCKDLATFFISLLKMHQIEAYPVLIRTRSHGVIYPEFPNSRFNHAIACVPMVDDTLWVDCTSDEATVNMLPRNDQGCNVVLINSNKSQLIQTPILSPESNQIKFEGLVTFESNGSASLEGTIEFSGVKASETRSGMKRSTLEERRESVIAMFRESAPGLELGDFEVINLDNKDLPLIVTLVGNIPRFGGKTGKRYFVNASLPGGIGWSGEHPSRRTMPYNAGLPSLYSSHVILNFSDEMTIESLPRDILLETAFGTYNQEYSENSGTLEMNFQFRDVQADIPYEHYTDYYQFRQSVKKAGSAQIVFLKN